MLAKAEVISLGRTPSEVVRPVGPETGFEEVSRIGAEKSASLETKSWMLARLSISKDPESMQITSGSLALDFRGRMMRAPAVACPR
jgi:hypothetical protein